MELIRNYNNNESFDPPVTFVQWSETKKKKKYKCIINFEMNLFTFKDNIRQPHQHIFSKYYSLYNNQFVIIHF